MWDCVGVIVKAVSFWCNCFCCLCHNLEKLISAPDKCHNRNKSHNLLKVNLFIFTHLSIMYYILINIFVGFYKMIHGFFHYKVKIKCDHGQTVTLTGRAPRKTKIKAVASCCVMCDVCCVVVLWYEPKYTVQLLTYAMLCLVKTSIASLWKNS